MTTDLAADLAGVLSEHLGRPVTVAGLKRLAGGSSHETWAFDAVPTIGDVIPLVLRREFAAGMLETDVEAEFELLRALFDAGVPVPEPLLYAVQDSPLGLPFMVMTRAPGMDLRKDLARPDCTRDRAALATETVQLLARIHAMPVDGEYGPAHEIERWTAVIEATKLDLDPLLATALTWLGRNLPPAVAPVLVHGDLKANNLLISPDGRLTVIDWELAHPGDPVEDLAWTMLWRTEWDVVGGLHGPESFVAAYAELTGRQIETTVLRFWRLFSLVKLWAMFLQGMTTENARPQLRMLGRATVWLADQLAQELLEAVEL